MLDPQEQTGPDEREPESLGLRIGVLAVRILAVPILLIGMLIWLLALVIAAPFFISRCLFRRFVKLPEAQDESGPDRVSLPDRAATPPTGQAEAIRS